MPDLNLAAADAGPTVSALGAGLHARLHARLGRVARYRPGRAPMGIAGLDGKLSANESALGPSPVVRAAAAAACVSPHRYPSAVAFQQRLAAALGVPAATVVLSNGSDELCHLLATAVLDRDAVAVLADPCYRIDETASLLAGAELRPVPLRDVDGAHDLDAMAAAVEDSGAALVWLPNPHNPTGAVVAPGALAGFLDRVPGDCLVVLDEAYRAFCDPALRPDTAGLLADYPNLVVQRTLSKDWGLAGLRLGYALAAAEVAEALNRIKPPVSVNSVALAAADAALSDADGAWRELAVQLVRRERDRLQQLLDRLGVRYYPSQANFVTVQLDEAELRAPLAALGLSVRNGDDLGLPGWSRISIGWAPQMALLRHALATITSSGEEEVTS